MKRYGLEIAIRRIEALRDSADFSVYLACAGAGGLFQLLGYVPGSSSFLAGGQFLYKKEKTEGFLGFTPDKFCSEETAINLAMSAYIEACDSDPHKKPIGLGLTVSVASLTEHRGDHKIHAAVVSPDEVLTGYKLLPKGVGLDARELDLEEADNLGLGLLLAATTEPGWKYIYQDRTELAYELLLKLPLFNQNGTRGTTEDLKSPILFPGNFNPPHYGHFEIAKGVSCHENNNKPVIFSLTVDPPHKEHLKLPEVLRRIALLKGHDVLISRGDSLYIDKARRHPGSTIVLGADSLERMLDPKWGTDNEKMFDEFNSLGINFMVYDRKIGDKLLTLDDLRHLIPVRHLIPAFFFVRMPTHWDVSSTEIRKSQGL